MGSRVHGMRFTSLSSGSEGNALVVESTVGSAHR
ncbi:MAG: hypothetical protein RL676_298, partial [Pseudomonadota bacterium]